MARRACLLALMLFAGCQFDPFTAVYTTKQPKPEDLVGLYLPSDATKKLIMREEHYASVASSIELHGDGTIVVTDLPDWWLTPFGKPAGGRDSGRGTWQIEKHQDWWVIGVHFQPSEHFSSQAYRHSGFFTQLFLIGEKPPYKIHLILGDPDEGRGMDFVRSKA